MYAYPFKNCMNTCRTYFTTLYIEYAPTLIRDPICSELPLPGGDLSMTLVQQCTHLRILRQILSFSSRFFLQNSSAKLVYLCGGETSSLRVGSLQNTKTKKKSQTRFPKKFNKSDVNQNPTKKAGHSDWESAEKNFDNFRRLQPFHLSTKVPRRVAQGWSWRWHLHAAPTGNLRNINLNDSMVVELEPIWDFIFAGWK